MSNQNKLTRLGDMLVERSVITRQQLREAIEIQQARQLLSESGKACTPGPIGEILIELGYINRQQLKQTLSWQSSLRKATLVMSFVAPILTTACGGGGGATNTPSNNKTANNTAVSSVTVEQSSSAISLTTTSSSSLSSQVASVVEQSSSAISLTPTSSSSVSSQVPSVPVESSSSSSAISLSSQQSSSATSHSDLIDGPVLLKWSVPSARENGDQLDTEEIGGYELRYKVKEDDNYTSVIVEGGYVNNYYFNHLEGNLTFEIAAYDTNGLYSRFVEIQPQLN